MPLQLWRSIGLPPHGSGGFDHGDVHLASGRVFVAHTALGTVEVIDGEQATHLRTVNGCSEASGVLCAQEEGLVVAAARGAGEILVLSAPSGDIVADVSVGPRPNGLAWDSRRRRVLVADVQEQDVQLADPFSCAVLAQAPLPGRPRWCLYDPVRDHFLVNIRDPACVAVLAAESLEERARWPVSAAGPHGLDLDLEMGRAFVACDAGVVAAIDLDSGREIGIADIAGEPDAIWYNPERGRLYVAVGRPGVVDVIDTQTLKRVEQIPTEAGAHTTAFDRTRQRLYVFLPRSCTAAVYDEV